MKNKLFFKIAGHVLVVNFPIEFSIFKYLPSFEPFLINESERLLLDDPILEVLLSMDRQPDFSKNLKVHADKSEIWGEGLRFEESDLHFITSLSNSVDNTKLSVVSSKDFCQSTIYLGDAVEDEYQLISWGLMIVFAQGVLPYNTVMIHASTVERSQQEAYAFLGKSGTGKSTHSQLWLQYLDNFTLLNDDNPAIRVIENEGVFIYGTPWSGKTSCYRDLKVPLKGIVRLRQAKANSFQLKKNSEAFIQLLPSCSGIRWNMDLFNGMIDSIESIIKVVPVGVLDCKVDSGAALLCYNGINRTN